MSQCSRARSRGAASALCLAVAGGVAGELRGRSPARAAAQGPACSGPSVPVPGASTEWQSLADSPEHGHAHNHSAAGLINMFPPFG